MSRFSAVVAWSLAGHGVLAAGVFGLKKPEHRETIAISVSETKKQKPPEPAKVTDTPKPVEKAEAPRQAKAKAAPAAPKADAPPESAPKAVSPVLDALPSFGLDMGNAGPGGLAVPQGSPAAAAPANVAAAPPPPKVLTAKPAEACSDPLVKPKPKSVQKPGYTAAAREANVDGRVRVEVSVSADGSVTAVRLLSGLGYGLDEAALEAARRATFEPATRCGKPVAATFVIAMRFSP